MKRTSLWSGAAIGVALSLVAAALSAANANRAVLFRSDFESGVLNDSATQSLSQGWQQLGTMPVITQDHARHGRYAMKAYLNKNTSRIPYRTMIIDAWHTTSDANNRTERNVPFFEDTWVGFSIYLPSKGPGNWMAPSNSYELLAQWHDSHVSFPAPSWDLEEFKNPLFHIGVTDIPHSPARQWEIEYIGESRTPFPVHGTPRPFKYETNVTKRLGPIDGDLDRWVDWVVRIRWNFWKVGTSNNSTAWNPAVRDNLAGTPTCGLIQVWKDGKLVLDESPVQIGSNDSAGPTFSAGLYKGWKTPERRNADSVVDRLMYFDEFKYGGKYASYADVAPDSSGPSNPPPILRPLPPPVLETQ